MKNNKAFTLIGSKELYHRYIKTMIYNMSKKKGGFFNIPSIDDKD